MAGFSVSVYVLEEGEDPAKVPPNRKPVAGWSHPWGTAGLHKLVAEGLVTEHQHHGYPSIYSASATVFLDHLADAVPDLARLRPSEADPKHLTDEDSWGRLSVHLDALEAAAHQGRTLAFECWDQS